MALSSPIASLLTQFHAHKPARIWSLIVTLYGDAIVPRGGSLWIGSLIDIMSLFDVDAGHVRTAVSRLSSDGWLSRVKRGRASYYRLSKTGETEFLSATQRIYFPDHRGGDLRIVLLGPELPEPAKTRRMLSESGFASLSPAIHVGLDGAPAALGGRTGVFLASAAADEARALAAAAWRLDDLAEAYRIFIKRFSPLMAQTAFTGDEALVARTLLIHAFRRIVLRDPGLPGDLLPPDWPGHDARKLTAAIYRQVLPPSEAFLDAGAKDENGGLPSPAADLGRRFPQ